MILSFFFFSFPLALKKLEACCVCNGAIDEKLAHEGNRKYDEALMKRGRG